MNNIDLMNYWLDSAEEDYKVMKLLYDNKKNNWCLFLGHLVIEKLLKALYAKNNKETPYAPKTHDLLYLSEKMQLKLSKEQKIALDTITKFNIEARYDDYKESFRKSCTDEYVSKQIENIKEVREWIKKLLMMK